MERDGVSNFPASPYLIVDILILNTSDGSTVLNEIQGDVCVSIWFLRCNRDADLTACGCQTSIVFSMICARVAKGT